MHRVPVRAARRQRERSARRHAEKTAIGVEQVENGEQVALVGPAAVEEDERAGRLAGRGPDERA